MSQTPHEQDRRIETRPLTEADFDAVVRIQEECFPGIPPWTIESFRQQLRVFPEGQIGIIVDGGAGRHLQRPARDRRRLGESPLVR